MSVCYTLSSQRKRRENLELSWSHLFITFWGYTVAMLTDPIFSQSANIALTEKNEHSDRNVNSCVEETRLYAHSEHRFPARPPNSARFSYATEGALFISAQLSSDAVNALRKVWVLITLRAPLSGTFLQDEGRM